MPAVSSPHCEQTTPRGTLGANAPVRVRQRVRQLDLSVEESPPSLCLRIVVRLRVGAGDAATMRKRIAYVPQGHRRRCRLDM